MLAEQLLLDQKVSFENPSFISSISLGKDEFLEPTENEILMCDKSDEEIAVERIVKEEEGYEMPLKTYLKEIREIKQLNLEEEQELFSYITPHKKLSKNTNGWIIDFLPRSERCIGEVETKNEIQNAIRARQSFQILTEKNLRLVFYLTKQFANRINFSVNNSGFMDLIQEGNLALMLAIAKFDQAKSDRLVSYASPTIKRAVRAAFFEKYLGSISDDEGVILFKMHNISCDLLTKLKREPYISEIVETYNQKENRKISISRATKIINCSNVPVSLNYYGEKGDGSGEYEDELADRLMVPQESIEKTVEIRMSINKLLNEYLESGLEQAIIFGRYYYNFTQKEIAKSLKTKTTRQNISLKEIRTLKKVRLALKKEYNHQLYL